MDDFIEFHNKVKSLDINKILFDVWSTFKVEEFIIKLNTEGLPSSQLHSKGVDSLGVSLTPAYTVVTLQMKSFKGQRIDHVTLKDTGEFYESFEVKPDAKGFKIIAVDRHGLKDKYGEEIIGLTQQNEKILIDFIEPFFNMEAKKSLS